MTDDLAVLKVQRQTQLDRVREAEASLDRLRLELLRLDMHIAQVARAASRARSTTPARTVPAFQLTAGLGSTEFAAERAASRRLDSSDRSAERVPVTAQHEGESK